MRTLPGEDLAEQCILYRTAGVILLEPINPLQKSLQTEKTGPLVTSAHIQAHRLANEIYFKN